jgi:hypothetical protein
VKEPRKPRLSRSELRTLVLEAGRAILLGEGIETGTDNLTFKRVFEHVGRTEGIQLTNASVIRRVWENQADFQADVLSAIARDVERPEVEETLHAVHTFLDGFDLSTPELRMGAMRELCRLVGAASSESLQNSPNWPLWISVVAMATTSSPSERRSRVQSALRDGYVSITEFWEASTEGFMAYLGLRFREPWTLRQYTITSTALSEGYALRQYIEGGLDSFMRPTGPDGELQEWTLFGAAMEVLAVQCVEPDPDITRSRALDGLDGTDGLDLRDASSTGGR